MISGLAFLNRPLSLDVNCNHVEMSISSFGFPILFMINAIGLSAGLCSLCYHSVEIMGIRLTRLFSFFGKFSIVVLLTHYVTLRIGNVFHVLGGNIITSLLTTLLVFLLSIPIIVFLRKYVPNLIGN